MSVKSHTKIEISIWQVQMIEQTDIHVGTS